MQGLKEGVHQDSRREAVDLPSTVAAAVEETVVESGGAALPELDLLRDDAVAAPKGGQGDLAFGELLADFGEFLHEKFAGGDDVALV